MQARAAHTKSLMRVKFPKPKSPKVIVYFGRWADSQGEVGPWSLAARSQIECRAVGTKESRKKKRKDESGENLKIAA